MAQGLLHGPGLGQILPRCQGAVQEGSTPCITPAPRPRRDLRGFYPGSWVAFSRVPCMRCSKEPLLQHPAEPSFLPGFELGQAVGCEWGSKEGV